MNPENTKKLFSEFPLLYTGKDKPLIENLMAFGFDCKDGWFQLIYDMSAILEILVRQYQQEDPNSECPIAVQVKEKFGGLRFYMNLETKEMEKLIAKAEKESYTICEVCSELGVYRGDLSWKQTLCDQCYEGETHKK